MQDTEKYSENEIVNAVRQLTGEYQKEVWDTLKFSDIEPLMNDEEHRRMWLFTMELNIRKLKMIHDAVIALPTIAEDMRKKQETSHKIQDMYKYLDADEKKKLALDMINDSEFQKDLCEILASDYERVIKENPTAKAIDNLFGIGKYYRKCVEKGIGTNHKYKID